jgi:hypothetical protein
MLYVPLPLWLPLAATAVIYAWCAWRLAGKRAALDLNREKQQQMRAALDQLRDR